MKTYEVSQVEKVHAFLVEEFARTANRRCVGVELLYVAGVGFHDASVRVWSREDDAEFFDALLLDVEGCVATILEVARDESLCKEIGKPQRFIVRTQQYIGNRPTVSFTMLVGDNNNEEEEDQMAKTGNKKTNTKISNDDDGVDVDDPTSTTDLDPRKVLLATVAAHVAASVVAAPSKKATSPEAIAEIAVDIAEAILEKVGL